MTAPALSVSPDAALHRQVLVETCEELALDPRDDLITILRESLSAHLGYTALEVHSVLLWTAYADSDRLALRVQDVYEAQVAVEAHDATAGHDVCCGGDCTCAAVPRHDRSRCTDCEGRPHERFDDALRALVELVEVCTSARAARDLAGAA